MKKPHLKLHPLSWLRSLINALSFTVLLLAYMLFKVVVQRVLTISFWGRLKPGKVRLAILGGGMRFLHALDWHEKNSISRLELIDLSVRNMALKKTRSIITIGGMAVGISVIVFLVSIGYGLQTLVVSRVAKLNEMKQAVVTTQPGAKLALNESVIHDFKEITGVDKVLPQITVVGRVNYQSSVSDMAVYGVTSDFLLDSAVQPLFGSYFTSNDTAIKPKDVSQIVTQPSPATTLSVLGKADTDVLAETSDNAAETEEPVTQVPLSGVAIKEAVVNKAMLQVLGMSDSQAVGKTFEVSFVIVGGLLETESGKYESVPTSYKVVAVVPDDASPYFYVPFIDLRSLGVDTYSQVKIVAAKQESLPQIRKQVEVLGFGTQSVTDTVSQINSLFETLRTVMVALGLGALFVASLGMFNTLTVSLLERTREVGLMKSMGMRSFEVRELFLTESMIMGFLGGVVGVVLGVILGKLLSLIITAVSLAQGGGVIDVSYVPFSFAMMIILISLFVGFLTGLYPSRRATKISALNALRYE